MKRKNIVDLAAMAHESYGRIEKTWTDRASACGIKFECGGEGCNACCKQLPLGSLVTGVLIADRLMKAGLTEQLHDVVQQGREQDYLFTRYGEDAAHIWHKRDTQCALLVDGDCSVYSSRPPACSSFYIQGGRAVCDHVNTHSIVGSIDNRRLISFSLELDGEYAGRIRGVALVGPIGKQVEAGMRIIAESD